MRSLLSWLSSLALVPQAAVFGFLALALELAVRNAWHRTPTYRRHLGILLLAALAAAFAAALGAGSALPHLVANTSAAALGLALSCLPLLWRRWLTTLSWRRGRPERPDPGVPLVLVADPHWSDGLTGLREATAALPGADWLFLGDIFDVWVGIPGMATPLQAEFLAWVAERRQAGRWVGLWLGNREYFLDRLAGHFDLMGEGIGGGLPAEALAWEHGDLINSADWRYRLWNLVSRSGLLWLIARLLPRATAQTLARALEQRMRTTNRAYKVTFPRQAFRAAAAAHPGQTFITGHFHTHEEEGNGTALPWAHEGAFMLWQNRTLQLFPRQPHL